MLHENHATCDGPTTGPTVLGSISLIDVLKETMRCLEPPSASGLVGAHVFQETVLEMPVSFSASGS
jgi:hypothetical protein